jgi:small subunit ribosomal protein S9
MATLALPHGTGRRKEAVARVILRPGSGKIEVNGRPFDAYFPTAARRTRIVEALAVTNNDTRFDVVVNVRGGGVTGQADAVRHSVARALLRVDDGLRPQLRKHGLLTRDPRAKERKKYGRKRARKGFQYSKR